MAGPGRALAALALAGVAACAFRVPLRYAAPAAHLRADGAVVACRSTQDRRTDREIDEVLAAPATSAVDEAIKDEIASAGVAREVVTIPAGGPDGSEGVSLIVEPTLDELAWEVPHYGRIRTTALVTSALTGGIGGLIYGSTPTDVYGRTKLTVTLIDRASGKQVTKSYAGSSRDRMAKLWCDGPSTRSRMVGESLRSAMQQFRADLVGFAGTPMSP